MNTAQAAEILDVSRHTVRHYIWSGQIEAVKEDGHWEIDKDSVLSFESKLRQMPRVLENEPELVALYSKYNNAAKAGKEIGVSAFTVLDRLRGFGYEFRKGTGLVKKNGRPKPPPIDPVRWADIAPIFKEYGLILMPSDMCPPTCPLWMGDDEEKDCLRSDRMCIYEGG